MDKTRNKLQEFETWWFNHMKLADNFLIDEEPKTTVLILLYLFEQTSVSVSENDTDPGY